MIYTVGEMAQKLGVPASTLRYYDKEGLLPFVERSYIAGKELRLKQQYFFVSASIQAAITKFKK